MDSPQKSSFLSYHFPPARELPRASEGIRGDQLVPAVLGIREKRAASRGLQVVMGDPQLALRGLPGPGGKTRQSLGKAAKDAPCPRR